MAATPSIIEAPQRQADCTSNSWSATREFTAAYYASDIEVADALAGLSPAVTINAPHPAQPNLRCEGPVIKQVSPNYWTATAKYSYGDKKDASPANVLPTIAWESGSASEAVDVDGNGNAYLNSAFDPYPQQFSQDRNMILIIVRNEPFYAPSISLKFENRVNSDNFTPLGLFTVEPGRAKCLSIRPTRPYQKTDIYVPIAYRFEFRSGGGIPIAPDITGLYDGFKTVILDQGNQGYYSEPSTGVKKRGFFYAKAGSPRLTNIRLNGFGAPLDTSILCGPSANEVYSAVNNPSALAATVVQRVTADAVFLKYQNFYTEAFSAIGL